jgi:hypothetical protein
MGTCHAIKEATQIRIRSCLGIGQSAGWPRVCTNTLLLRSVVLVAVLCSFVFLPACHLLPNSAAMSGPWTFTIRTISGTIVATTNLTQNGNQFSGTLTLVLNATACGSGAALNGTVQGNNLTFEIVQGPSEALLTGTANQTFTAASGMYNTTSGGDCFQPGDSGNWSAFFGQG